MPRTARIKNSTSISHVMIRSISEISLFKCPQDKEKYLEIVQKYQKIFLFKLYAYCLMTTHAHFIIDCNGADISKFMKAINQCYAMYFNKKYNRHGHVFQDRFKSKLINNEKYLLILSAYIHNNPKDIVSFNNRIEHYEYSSLGIYLGIFSDKYKILDSTFILQHFSSNTSTAKTLYLKFINANYSNTIQTEAEFKNEGSEYRSERKILIRNLKPEDIVNFVANHSEVPFCVNIKFNHSNIDLKSVCVVIMRSLCNLTYKEICEVIGNITQSSIGRLCQRGLNLISKNPKYSFAIKKLIEDYSLV